MAVFEILRQYRLEGSNMAVCICLSIMFRSLPQCNSLFTRENLLSTSIIDIRVFCIETFAFQDLPKDQTFCVYFIVTEMDRPISTSSTMWQTRSFGGAAPASADPMTLKKPSITGGSNASGKVQILKVAPSVIKARTLQTKHITARPGPSDCIVG